MVIHDILLPQSIAYIDELFAGLSAALRSCGGNLVEGYSYQIPKQITRISELIVSRRPSSILEIGFNGGHSALLFLAITSPQTRVVSFDLGQYSCVFAAKKYIDSVFPGRHMLVTGDSTQTIPQFIAEHPSAVFDAIFIDGGHEGDIPLQDCVNCMRLANETTLLMMDDITREKRNVMGWSVSPSYAWDTMCQADYIIEAGYDSYYGQGQGQEQETQPIMKGRGMAWGFYNTAITLPAEKREYEILKLFYKTYNREQMYSKIQELYYAKNVKPLYAVSDMYLEYFGHLDNASATPEYKETNNQVRFYRAFALFDLNPVESIRLFEEMMDLPNLDKDLSFYCMCNLGALYKANATNATKAAAETKATTTIPKIIHLLYFGETEFHNYHHRCVESMLQHMPDYAIRIYNVDEPAAGVNTYWDRIKTHPRIEIVKILIPEYYDGFKLHHFQYKADVVRLEILYEFGGVYLDLDMLIFRNFDELFSSGHAFYISKERNDRDCLINAFLAAKPKNEFLKIWLNAFKSGLRMGVWAHHIRDTNKKLLDDHPHYYVKYDVKILDGDEFFPIHWEHRDLLTQSETQTIALPAAAYGTHLWETILHDVLIRNEFLCQLKPDPVPLPVPEPEETITTFYANNDNQICLTVVEDPVVSVDSDYVKEPQEQEQKQEQPQQQQQQQQPQPQQQQQEKENIQFLLDPAAGFAQEIVVICLEERPLRTEYIVNHLSEYNLKHTVLLNHLHPTNQRVGCFQSHMRALRYAKDNQLTSVLILEDDAQIRPNIVALKHTLLPAPETRDILYLGGWLTGYRDSDATGKWHRGTFWCNHAYLIYQHMYDKILAEYDAIEDKDTLEDKNIDYFYTAVIQPKYNVWLAHDQYIIQKEGYSEIDHRMKWSNGFKWEPFAMNNFQ
jgi:predicted O-methyltransferase YrrM